MNTQDSGGAAGRETAPEGKGPNGPGPVGAAAEGKDGWEGGGGDAGEWTATEARYDELEGMLQEDAFDINTTECGPEGWIALAFALGGNDEPHDEKAVKLVLGAPGVHVNVSDHLGRTVLLVQCHSGRSRNVELLLADPRVDVNQADSEGVSPLYAAAGLGRDRCVELLLADPRVDVNQVSTITGASPLNMAAHLGKDRYVELLLADPRVDVCRASANGKTPRKTPLLSACIYLKTSMDQVGAGGGNDPARCLVLMLKSRRLPKHNVEETIKRMGNYMPTRRQIDNAEAGGEPLTPEQKLCRIVLTRLVLPARWERGVGCRRRVQKTCRIVIPVHPSRAVHPSCPCFEAETFDS